MRHKPSRTAEIATDWARTAWTPAPRRPAASRQRDQPTSDDLLTASTSWRPELSLYAAQEEGVLAVLTTRTSSSTRPPARSARRPAVLFAALARGERAAPALSRRWSAKVDRAMPGLAAARGALHRRCVRQPTRDLTAPRSHLTRPAGSDTPTSFHIVMDEFHIMRPRSGVAWQAPLLTASHPSSDVGYRRHDVFQRPPR